MLHIQMKDANGSKYFLISSLHTQHSVLSTSTSVARQTVVALLYNDIPSTPSAEDRSAEDAPVDLTAEALGFTPYFDLEDIPAEQEYANIEAALVDAGYKVASYNVKDRFERLFKFLARRKIDVIFNLVEFF